MLLAAAAADAGRPALFLREDFKETPAATPITQEHITNGKVVMSLYGPGREGMKRVITTRRRTIRFTCGTAHAAGIARSRCGIAGRWWI